MSFRSYDRTVDADGMPGMTLENIARACEGTYVGSEALYRECITGIEIDSRKVSRGCLFVPIKGARVDGHDFIPQVMEQGAMATLTERPLKDAKGPYILVDSTTDALKAIAAFYRRNLDIKVVGITGSVGKTSTKEMIASVLEQKFEVLKTAGNFNNEIGLPLTIFQIRRKHEVAVLEMGISDFGEMSRLAKMANPDICVITNIGLCHLENLGTRDGILKAKTESFDYLTPNGIAVLNGDDDKLCTKQLVNEKPPVFYGMGSTSKCESGLNNQIYLSDIENLGFEGNKALFHTPAGDFEAWVKIPGEHNLYNAMAAVAVGLELGLTLDEIKAGIETGKTIAGRTNFLHLGDVTVIDDCYNANPVSMAASLDVLSYGNGRTIAVLGDMGELGAEKEKLHREVGKVVGEKKIEVLFAAGKLAREYVEGAKETEPLCDTHYYENLEAMLPELLSFVKPGDNILVKASHFMDFPQVVKNLESTFAEQC